AADPLPPSIQLYGCNIVESPLIFASPLIYWLGALMLFLLISLFFLNKEMRKNQADLDRANRELELRRSIEDSISSAIVITDLENKIVYTNPAAQVITGYSEDELQGKTPPYPFWADTSVLPATLLGDPSKLDPAAFPYRFDLLVRHKDDEQLNVLLLATPFYSSYNEHIGWIYMMRDNTIESQSMNLTNDAIASYQRLLNSVMSCISVVSHKPTGTMLGIHNDHYTEQLGNTADGHLAISRACKIPFNPQGSREAEVWVDSLERWFSITEARVTLPGGSHVTLQSAQDITQRKINEKELEDQTNRMENSSRLITLGEMASTITHEINQPLTAITAYANTAIEVIGNAPEVNRGQVLEIYKKIANQAGRIDKIIKNIRAFAKRRPTTLENVPLANVINDTQELGKLIEKKYAGIRIIYELPKVLPNVLCDPVQIMQILMNLIRNAAEAILEAGCTDRTIAVIAKVGANEVELQVADHGPGISDTMKASLFTPFFSTKKNGLGLGLSTCQTIAESHNTRLRVRDNEGGGTVFVFDLKICS
ncbi:ATP-binding protein, partial [uncultured Parasutterella sp.]